MSSKSNRPLGEYSVLDAENELRRRQLGLVRAILWAALVVGVPTAAVASVRAISIGEPGRAAVYIGILLALISILAWRGSPFGLQVFLLVGSLYALAVYELAYEGLIGNGPVFLLSAVSMATLVMARSHAFLLLMLAVGIFAGFAWLFTSGGLEVSAGRLPSSGELGEWIATGLVFLMLTGMLYASQSYLIPALTRALNRAQKLAGELRGTVTERLKAQSDLEELNRELEARVAARTAELEAANIELDSFASTVSHDLRAPLHSMNWFSARLVEDHSDELSPDARQKTDRIQTAAERMEQLIDALLALSRVTRGSLDIGEIDLSRLAEAVVDDLRNADSERKADVEIEPGLIDRGDQTLVKSVLENLIGNAWKFSSKRDDARIRFGRDDDESARCGVPVYIVEDNGAGFEMEHAKDLFKPFTRLHRVDEFAGTGVGLATVQRIVRRHGGRIWALGRAGDGAEIRFTLGPDSGDAGGNPASGGRVSV